MKRYLLLTLCIVGCGQEPSAPTPTASATPTPTVTVLVPVQGAPGPQGEKGESAPSPSPTPSLEGYYTFDYGGYADIYRDAQGMYTIRSLRLVLLNQDGSTGLVPLVSTGQLADVNEVVHYNLNLAYVAATHNIKTDVSNALLNATYFTEINIRKNGNRLKFEVIVNSSNGILFSHSIASN